MSSFSLGTRLVAPQTAQRTRSVSGMGLSTFLSPLRQLYGERVDLFIDLQLEELVPPLGPLGHDTSRHHEQRHSNHGASSPLQLRQVACHGPESRKTHRS